MERPTSEELSAWFESLPRESYEEFKKTKEQARLHDWERIANGEATVEQIQRENEILPAEQVQQFRILNLDEVLDNIQ